MDGIETATEEEVKLLRDPDADFFSDYKVAYNYVYSATRSHDKQWKLVDAMEEHIEGKKPMDQKRLDELGMSWAYNYNYYRARGKIESAVSEFVEKMNQSLSLGYPEFRNYEEDDKDTPLRFLMDYNERGIVASAIGCAFSEMLEVEGEIQTFLNQTEYVSYTFGYCPVSWPIHDWKGDPIHIKHLATRPGSTITELNEWVIFKTETNNWLYEKYNSIKDKDPDEDGFVDGWSKEAIELALTKLYKGKIETDNQPKIPDTWQEILPFYNQNPSLVISDTSDIRLAKIYYKEVNGSFAEVYIPWGYDWCDPSPTQGTLGVDKAGQIPEILYKKHYDVLPKELIGFVRDSGFTVSGEISKMRGAGRLIVEDSQRYNRTRNSMNNKALFSGSPWFETNSTQGQEKFKVTFSQGFVMMPPGGIIAERQPQFSISENIGLLQFEEREFSENYQHFNPSATSRLSSRPTKDEIALASAEAGRSRTAKDAVKISDYSKIFLQFIKKMARTPSKSDCNYQGHRRFFDLLIRYLPQYVSNDEEVIKILKAINSYSISLVLGDIQAIQVAIGMAETPFGRNRYRRMLLIAMGHSRKEVDILVPLYQDKYRFMQDDRIAAIENDMFWNTNEVVFQLTDDHVTHFRAHQSKFEKVIQGVRGKQLDIVIAWKYLINLFAHMQLHIDPLLEDASLKNIGEEFLEVLKQDNQVLRQVEFTAQKVLKDRADAAVQQPAISPKDAADIAREDAKTQANIQRQDYKAQERVRQQDEQQAHKEALDERRLEADITIDAIKASNSQ